jgi:hypothetical protein
MAERKLPVGDKKRRTVADREITTCEILGPSIVDLIRAGMRPSMAAQATGLSVAQKNYGEPKMEKSLEILRSHTLNLSVQ